MTDAQWARLEPLIPPGKTGGRPRQTDMRAAMNAIFYLLRTGCAWRYLPRDPFPPRSTVYNIFRKFQHEGVWERIWEELLVALREQRGREASPTVELDRIALVTTQLAAVEHARDALIRMDAEEHNNAAALLLKLKGLGPEFASLLWLESLFRSFGNRRQVAAFGGLAPSPWQSGGVERDQGISKSGNRRLRHTA